MDTWNRLMAVGGEVKGSEGISQRTHVHNSQTQTAVWGEGWVEVGKGREICNTVKNKLT